MAETLTKDAGLALLGNTLPTGAILVVLITILGPISGAHFNPAVSLVFALKRDLRPHETGLYMLANHRRHCRDLCGAPDVRPPHAGNIAESADRRRAMVCGMGGDIR